MNISSNKINIKKDTLLSALQKKSYNSSLSNKTLTKLVKLANTELGLTKKEARCVFIKNESIPLSAGSTKLLYNLKSINNGPLSSYMKNQCARWMENLKPPLNITPQPRKDVEIQPQKNSRIECETAIIEAFKSVGVNLNSLSPSWLNILNCIQRDLGAKAAFLAKNHPLIQGVKLHEEASLSGAKELIEYLKNAEETLSDHQQSTSNPSKSNFNNNEYPVEKSKTPDVLKKLAFADREKLKNAYQKDCSDIIENRKSVFNKNNLINIVDTKNEYLGISLALKWITEKLAGSSAFSPEKNDDKILQEDLLQLLKSTEGSRHDFIPPDCVNYLLGKNIDKIVAYRTAGVFYPGGYILFKRNPENGSIDTSALYNDKNSSRVSFYDPQKGEFDLDGKMSFRNFYEDYMKKMYPGYEQTDYVWKLQ
ncbi:hypothetical protein [Kalamiella sp. sgz302252]|uniref:hypothetical protein n=1 Tax=Pantoea sp. sgz302252 TaxID=3341827 RepID=UPI0036D358F0